MAAYLVMYRLGDSPATQSAMVEAGSSETLGEAVREHLDCDDYTIVSYRKVAPPRRRRAVRRKRGRA